MTKSMRCPGDTSPWLSRIMGASKLSGMAYYVIRRVERDRIADCVQTLCRAEGSISISKFRDLEFQEQRPGGEAKVGTWVR